MHWVKNPTTEARVAALARIQSMAWELSYAVGATLIYIYIYIFHITVRNKHFIKRNEPPAKPASVPHIKVYNHPAKDGDILTLYRIVNWLSWKIFLTLRFKSFINMTATSKDF